MEYYTSKKMAFIGSKIPISYLWLVVLIKNVVKKSIPFRPLPFVVALKSRNHESFSSR